MTRQMVTANRLRDGAVVFLAAGGRWTVHVAEGHVAEEESHAAALLKAAEAQPTVVVGPYLIEVTVEAGAWRPVRYRERIRAAGPSIPLPKPEAAERA
ncbi:MAG TPA: DUF2849 domain-containing protein [Dongiaceae bacterium]|nr:DUF2849 domain-containing protein [Dongiaceae bacterium]